MEGSERDTEDSIAVIGIGCRFPGGSNSPEEFWEMLAEGRDAVTEIPTERYDIDDFYHPDVTMPGKTNSRWGSYLDQIDHFDASFFGISSTEATFMDPQQRVLLEVTWEALERAGLPAAKLAGSSTGVFVGIFNSDYSAYINEEAFADRGLSVSEYVGTGTGNSFAAGRISYVLGLQGPSMVVDTVCSSSLVAVHLACQSLRNGECGVALAGAVDLNFHPLNALITSKMRVFSPQGRCQTFDAGADGFVRGEGCGVLVLKRHSQAVADGDAVLAVIRGSAVNHDGRSRGLTAPNGKAQEAVIRQALKNAGVAPEQISYVEAHGTGTKRGDPIEFAALQAVIGQAHPKGSACFLGSVKTNIGHLEAAAGMAGLVKTIMCMQHQAVSPHLHFETVNPRIDLENSPFVIPTRLSRWALPKLGPRFAGVSAAGLTGTNAHIVLEEAVDSVRSEDGQSTIMSQLTCSQSWLLPLSAKNADGLRQLVRTWCKELQRPDKLGNASLRNICSTASLRRTHYEERLAVVGSSHGELAKQLDTFLHEERAPVMNGSIQAAGGNTRRPVFVFSGQGAQWIGMGKDLLQQESVFRAAIEKCDILLRQHVSWSLLTELQVSEGQSRLHETEVAQPALFSVQLALSEVWRSWGIEPAAVVGHSVGEITAAHVAGALNLEDAIRIVACRGQLMQQTDGLGFMAAVEMSETQALEFLDGYSGRVAIGAVNSPTSIVLSGETAALHEILEKMQNCQIPFRKLNVKSAFHSPQMEPLLAPLIDGLRDVKATPTTIPWVSSVTGEASAGEDCDAAYWGRNMCQTVCFSSALEKLLDLGYDTFVEISPQPVLARCVKQCLSHLKRPGAVLSSTRRGANERTTMLRALGSLYTLGLPIRWEQLYLASSSINDKVVQLPTYPWQRKRYWLKTTEKPFSRQPSTAVSSKLTGHPLLGRRVRSATRDVIFETSISTNAFPWLADHQAFGLTIFPASGYVEMMQESVRIAFKSNIVRLTDLCFHQALSLLPDQESIVQVVLKSSSDNSAGEVEILSCSEEDDTDVWTLNASGRYDQLQDRQAASCVAVPECTDLGIVKQRCTQIAHGQEHYERMHASGLAYGPAFQAVKEIWWRQGEALGQLTLPKQLAREHGPYFMHPAFLDACLQTVSAAIASNGHDEMYLPISMDNITFHQRPSNEIWVRVEVSKSDVKNGLIVANLHILNERGKEVARIDGLHLRRASRSALAGQRKIAPPHWLYELRWNLKPHLHSSLALEGGHIPSPNPRSWLFFCDINGTGIRLASNLRARGEQCVLIFAEQRYQKMLELKDSYTVDPSNPEHFEELLHACIPLLKLPRCDIVYSWALDESTTVDASSEQIMEEQQRLCGGLLHLVQAVAQKRWATSPQLWVMTQNSQNVSGLWAGSASGAVQRSLWGLGRVIAYEHPDLHCRLVDFPDQNLWDRERFVDELLNPDPEEQIAMRIEGRYIARLAAADSDPALLRKLKQQQATGFQNHESVIKFSATGTYLITGGLGGLGIAIAQWMVEQRGARHLVLTGRRAPTTTTMSTIRQLEERGAQIRVVQADVADEKQVATVLESIKQAEAPLRGVIHAAGVLDDGVLLHLNWERFVQVLVPKVKGSWNLHVLTRDLQLDFFALFSSAAALVPAAGQANYATANAFMDGLAHYRRSQGLPAVSINWGAWADVGMTKDAANFERRLEREGVQLMSIDEGMAAFEQVLVDNPTQIAVLPIDWGTSLAMRRQSPFVSDVVGESVPHMKEAMMSGGRGGSQAINQHQPYSERVLERPQILLEDVSRHSAQVLGLDPMSRFDCGWNLFDRGMDSFMAIELRNALQKETSLSLSANFVFDHPTVEGIAAYLALQLSRPMESVDTITVEAT